MFPFKFEVIEYSRHFETGKDLISVACTYPRYIHAEVMTHRVFSRNASSSRAIPVMKNVELVRQSPVIPIYLGKNKKGMQAVEEVDEDVRHKVLDCWIRASQSAADFAEELASYGLHKELANRVLEPFMPIKTLITSSEWHNFMELRDHEDAQREIQEVARGINHVVCQVTPTILHYDQWHLPYIREEERSMPLNLLLRLSTARSARTSYNLHDGTVPDRDSDLRLYDDLLAARPFHASPCEHQAKPEKRAWWRKILKIKTPECGNFDGWIQHRKLLERNNFKSIQ